MGLSPFTLAPRYRLDDELPWLVGIDPSRHYWIQVNGESELTIAIPGLVTDSIAQFKQVFRQWRSLASGERMELPRIASTCTIICISENCYALELELNGVPVWHLFDRETLESLLMTAHPDWQCAPKDVELGRKLLLRSLQQTVAA